LGNFQFRTSTNQAPRYAQPGEPMQEMTIIMELKLLADVGLVGYPNAGKSTLLSAVSSARHKIVKIADELDVNIDVIRHIIETDYEPYQVTRYSKVQDTDGHGWRLFSQLTDDNDVDFTYYNGLVRAAYDNIASVGDPNIIFAGTKWENVKPYV
jgi:hypothetical protein